MKKALTFDDIQIIPKYSEIHSRSKCVLKTNFTKNNQIELPYVSAPMDTVTEYEMALRMAELGGVGCMHRFLSIEKQSDIIERLKFEINEGIIYQYKNIPICAAIGTDKQYSKFITDALGDEISFDKRLEKLVESGVNILLIDVAHGNTLQVKETIELIKVKYPDIDVIAGNVATYEGATNLCEWGADAVRVGIGNGSLCTTRLKTGVGIPQVTAIIECVKACEKYGVPVIADGGIRNPADVAKALALGADSVMLGSLLAGTKETPGEIQRTGDWPREHLYKKYRGSASLEVKRENHLDEKNVEGESTLVPYIGKVERIIKDINDGVRSAMSYVGANTLEEFRAKSEFVEITSSGIAEAKPHLLK